MSLKGLLSFFFAFFQGAISPPQGLNSSQDCQKYLMNAPVELQCGSMCTLYGIKGLIEGHLGYQLSTTYAHLALAASGFTLVNNKDLNGHLNSEEWYEAKSKSWNAIISEPILAFGSFGILSDAEFPSDWDRSRFLKQFGKTLDPQGVRDVVHGTLTVLVEAIRNAKAGKTKEAENLFQEYRRQSQLVIDYMSEFKVQASKKWRDNFSNVSFTHLLIFGENAPGSPEQGNAALNRMFNVWAKELNFLGKYSHRLLTPEQFRDEILVRLSKGNPAVLGIEHRENGGHVVLGIDVELNREIIICRDTACFTSYRPGFRKIEATELLKPETSALILDR